jgi:hydrogenase maturation protease
MHVGVIGLGNPLRGDDGIGIVLLHRLQAKRKPSWHEIEFVDGGTGGLSLVHDLARFTHVLLVDAVDFQGVPGDYHIFAASDFLGSSRPPKSLSTHEPGLAEVLHLAAQLHSLPGIVKVFGVQPADMTYRSGLSSAVTEQVDGLTRSLSSLLDQLPRLR